MPAPIPSGALPPAHHAYERIGAVVGGLADRRLLITTRDPTSDKPIVELVHEAVIREWSRLLRRFGLPPVQFGYTNEE